ncbi:MAG: arginine deiminase-related protein [Nitrospinota bacterium]|nr:arginine deiminase-related protein [Nitrospinota bacterium]
MKPSILMCPPEYFGVRYSINPWMEGQIGRVDSALALRQWIDFYRALKQQADIHLIDPQPHVPDLVFTANAGLILDGHFISSRFKHEERRREEPLFNQWFETRSARSTRLPKNLFFEGAGDALQQPGRNLLWAGYGFRTDRETHQFLAEQLGLEVVSLHLIHPRFYHLDTCLCPLPDDQIMYYPAAFDAASLKLIETRIQPENRIVVSEEDAVHFACNAVLMNRVLFLNHASPKLIQLLEHKGYTPAIQPVSEFLKAGGANKCLTLPLS